MRDILIALAGAAVGGVLPWLLGFVDLRNHPPDAQIAPSATISAPATEVIEFSAAASSDPEGRVLTFDWQVGGQQATEAQAAACSTVEDTLLRCQFVLPGQFPVAVTVTDDRDQTNTAVTSVQVGVPDAYAFLFAKSGDHEETRLVRKALLHAADWPEVQRQFPYRRLLLWDPDRQHAVFASQLGFDPEKSREILAETGLVAISGVKLLVSGAMEMAMAGQRENLASAGIDFVMVPVAAGEVVTAMSTGLASSGFIPLDSPTAAAEFVEDF